MLKAQSFEDLQLKDIRDTANYFQNKSGGKPSLAKLAEERLGIKIQSGEHSPVQDARAALRIYLGVRREWEDWIKKGKGEKNINLSLDESSAGFDLEEEL